MCRDTAPGTTTTQSHEWPDFTKPTRTYKSPTKQPCPTAFARTKTCALEQELPPLHSFIKEYSFQDFPGSLLVKTWPLNAGGWGFDPCWGAKISRASQPKNQNMKQRHYCNKLKNDLKKKKRIQLTFASEKKKKQRPRGQLGGYSNQSIDR